MNSSGDGNKHLQTPNKVTRSDQEKELRLLIDNVPSFIAYVDATKKYRMINKAYEAFFGIREKDAIGRPVKEKLHPDLYAFLEKYIDTVLKGKRTSYELAYEDSVGGTRDLRGNLIPFLDRSGSQNGYLVIVDDVTEQQHLIEQIEELNRSLEKKVIERTLRLQEQTQELETTVEALRESEERLQYLTIKDDMTGLLNRRGWEECLQREESRANRNPEQLFAVAIIDIDGLKEINDTQGHYAGDRLLMNAAQAISESVRSIDHVARLGGDEFAILFVDHESEETQATMQRIETALLKVSVMASWGIAIRESDRGLLGAMKEADKRMYQMKTQRRSNTLN